MQGTVDRVVAEEGFGSIIGPIGEEYFFHRTALKGVDWEEIGPGVKVTFQPTRAWATAPTTPPRRRHPPYPRRRPGRRQRAATSWKGCRRRLKRRLRFPGWC